MYFGWRVGYSLTGAVSTCKDIERKDMLFIQACMNEERLLVCVLVY